MLYHRQEKIGDGKGVPLRGKKAGGIHLEFRSFFPFVKNGLPEGSAMASFILGNIYSAGGVAKWLSKADPRRVEDGYPCFFSRKRGNKK